LSDFAPSHETAGWAAARCALREVSAACTDERLARAFFALLWLGLLFRLDLYSFTFLERAGPLGLHVGAVRVFRHTLSEPLFALAAVALVGSLLLVARAAHRRLDTWGEPLLFALLIGVGFIYGLQRHLIDALNVGVSYELLIEAAGATPLREVFRQMETVDLVYSLGPAAVFWAQRQLSPRGRRLRDRTTLLSLTALLILGISGLDERPLPRNATALVEPPVLFLIADVFDALTHPAEQRFPAAPDWKPAQVQKMRLDDPAFGVLLPGTVQPVPGVCHTKQCSVLVVLMESVGARYVFDESLSGSVPMPALSRLSKQGLWLSRHHSTNNSSPHSIFSILTGLYPLPAPGLFSTTDRVSVPSLFSLLPRNYERFFYSAGPLEWYFPYGLLRNSGLEEIVDESEIPPHRPRSPTAANELDAVDAFVARIGRAKGPFVGVYYSYVPHYPYRDYGPEYRVVEQPRQRIERYYNNLRLLDTQLERIVQAARAHAPRNELVVLLVGDHGEAFGQHRGNWVHLTQSYEENFETVALLLHDEIFPARVESRLSSHVDLLPTLLDALGVPYPEAHFQGVSWLRADAQREYAFVYGSENTLGAIRDDGRKVLASFRSGRASVFELATDPQERHGQALARGDTQLEAALQFRLFQLAQLPRYNDAVRRGEQLAEARP
jgi:lipoteichoic acid synthase